MGIRDGGVQGLRAGRVSGLKVWAPFDRDVAKTLAASIIALRSCHG